MTPPPGWPFPTWNGIPVPPPPPPPPFNPDTAPEALF
jgi:hypothetical protein